MKPMNDMVLIIEEQKKESMTSSGIITGVDGLPVAGRGEVYEVPGSWSKEIKPMLAGIDLKKGDKILYSKFSAEEVHAKNKDGVDIKGLKSVHVTAIIATYTDIVQVEPDIDIELDDTTPLTNE